MNFPTACFKGAVRDMMCAQISLIIYTEKSFDDSLSVGPLNLTKNSDMLSFTRLTS